MMKKGRNEKKKRFLFFRLSLFAGAEFWKEPGRNKTSTPLSSRTHFQLFGSAPLFQRFAFSRPPNPCRSPCLGPTPSTDEKRQFKDDKPGIPMIGSQGGTRLSFGLWQTSKMFQCLYKGQNSKHFSSSVKVTKYIKTDSNNSNS